jgi:hypothetical protein
MLQTRRQLVFGVLSTVGLLASSFAASRTQYPPPRPTPPGAGNPGSLAGAPKPVNPHVLTQKNQELLKSDVDQLFQLASELRKEYQAANPNVVLSVTFVKLAEQAEKIAKQVRNLARG